MVLALNLRHHIQRLGVRQDIHMFQYLSHDFAKHRAGYRTTEVFAGFRVVNHYHQRYLRIAGRGDTGGVVDVTAVVFAIRPHLLCGTGFNRQPVPRHRGTNPAAAR
ncbi:hypothetical protein D3C78_1621980 [compost metagenome]